MDSSNAAVEPAPLRDMARGRATGGTDGVECSVAVGRNGAGCDGSAGSGRVLAADLASGSRRRVAARPERSPRMAATIWYERMLRMLSKRGWQKLPTQTPAEFVAAFKDEKVRNPMADLPSTTRGRALGSRRKTRRGCRRFSRRFHRRADGRAGWASQAAKIARLHAATEPYCRARRRT